MRYCVFGLGAVGGYIGGRLAAAGLDVCAVARGDTFASVRRHGLRLEGSSADTVVRIPVVDSVSEVGPVDCVLLAVKATVLPAAAPLVASLLGPDTVIVPMMNGVPWWFTHHLPSPLTGLHLPEVDPGGTISASLPPSRVIPAVVHFNATVPRPGTVRLGAGNRIIVGDPSGTHADALAAVARDLAVTGLDVDTSDVIHRAVWFKLWGNMTFNPISAITGATADLIVADPLAVEFIESCMHEANDVGTALGLPVAQSPTERIDLTRQMGPIKSSMLQDAEASRPLELDAILGSVVALGSALGIATPNLRGLLGLARVFATAHGL